MEYFTDTDGRRRKGVWKDCGWCKAAYLSRADRPKSFCSKDCQQKAQKRRVELQCDGCGASFDRPPSKTVSSKSGLYFCKRACKDKSQRLGGIAAIMPPHYGTASVTDYRGLFGLDEFVCCRCGYQEFDCGVDIHHIDEDRTNNEKDNLIPLCKCCHIGLHNNRWSLKELQGPRV